MKAFTKESSLILGKLACFVYYKVVLNSITM